MKWQLEGVAEAMARASKRRRLLKDRFQDENLDTETWKKQAQAKLKRKREGDEVEVVRELFGNISGRIGDCDGVVDDLAQKRRKLFAFDGPVEEEDLVSMEDVEMGGVDYSQASISNLSKLPTPPNSRLNTPEDDQAPPTGSHLQQMALPLQEQINNFTSSIMNLSFVDTTQSALKTWNYQIKHIRCTTVTGQTTRWSFSLSPKSHNKLSLQFLTGINNQLHLHIGSSNNSDTDTEGPEWHIYPCFASSLEYSKSNGLVHITYRQCTFREKEWWIAFADRAGVWEFMRELQDWRDLVGAMPTIVEVLFLRNSQIPQADLVST